MQQILTRSCGSSSAAVVLHPPVGSGARRSFMPNALRCHHSKKRTVSNVRRRLRSYLVTLSC